MEIPGYSYFPSQSHTPNGGVALYVKSGFTPIPRPDLCMDSIDFESVWVEVDNKQGKIFFVVLIVIQLQLLIPSMNICKKFYPTQLCSINMSLS